MLKKQLLIILFIFWAQESSCFMSELFDIVENVWKFAKHLNDIKSSKDTLMDIRSFIADDDGLKAITAELKVMNHKLDNLKAYTVDKLNYITLLIEQLPAELAIQSKKDELAKFVRTANKLWSDLTSFIERGATDEMFLDMANDIQNNLKLQLLEFRNVLAPLSGDVNSPHEGLFMLIVENAEKKRDVLCGPGETSHHKILSLFQIAISTEIKAHTLLFIAHFIKYSNNDAWKMPLEKDFKEQFNRYVDTCSNALKITKLPYIRSCDPDVWRLDDNCHGLHGYLQQTIYRTKFQPHTSSGNFTGLRASELPSKSKNGKAFPIFALNKHVECEGQAFDCSGVLGFFRDATACVWETGPYNVRYIKHTSEAFGTDKEAIAGLLEKDEKICSTDGIHYVAWHSSDTNDEIYSCQCPESTMKLLRQTIDSKWHENYVIVGVRIRNFQDYIYIQIAEGRVEANGYISNYSWVSPLRAIESSWPKSIVLDRVKRDEDVFFLGDVQLSPGYALTSIGFVRQEVYGVKGTAIEIGGCELEYGTGELFTFRKFRFLLGNEAHRELTFPTKTPINKTTSQHTSPKSDGYTHVRLKRSDLSDDYGQTTLPLLDGLPVMNEPLSPIGGVGFFYKASTDDYAGFLSLRLYPLNFTFYVDIFKRTNDVNLMLNSTH